MADAEFPVPPSQVLATLLKLLSLQGEVDLVELLKVGEARIEETGWDNWNGGTSIYTLFVDVPIEAFAKIEGRREQLEKTLALKLQAIVRDTGNQVLRQVDIRPALEGPVSKVAEAEPTPTDVGRLWGAGSFRLFITHVAAHKAAVSALKRELAVYGVSGFVAHEDIEPSLEWQTEIELALRSMHALVALLDIMTSGVREG